MSCAFDMLVWGLKHPKVLKIHINTIIEVKIVKGQLKCDGTRAETRFRLSAKRMNLYNLLATELLFFLILAHPVYKM